jgi:hypothetical protein
LQTRSISSCKLGSEFEAPQDVVTIANARKTALVFNIIGSFILISYVDPVISPEPKRLYVGNAPLRLGSFIGNTPKTPLDSSLPMPLSYLPVNNPQIVGR